MSTLEEQIAAAIQRLNVRFQQLGTMAPIVQAERDDLASQVQSATSTIIQKQPGVVDTRVIYRPDEFDGDPMKYSDWLSRLRASFGAVDQWYQLESKTTQASSTPRLDAKLSCEASRLSTQMHYMLVMTVTGSASDKCHSAGMNEGFEARKQFVKEWETEFVGLLMNVLPTKVGSVRMFFSLPFVSLFYFLFPIFPPFFSPLFFPFFSFFSFFFLFFSFFFFSLFFLSPLFFPFHFLKNCFSFSPFSLCHDPEPILTDLPSHE